MPWPIKLGPPKGHDEREIGDAWFAEGYEPACCPWYHERNKDRPPLFVVLPYGDEPKGQPFLVDGFTYSGGKRGPAGWQVTGKPPNITVAPSIHIPGYYHGFIKNGVVGDDIDKRSPNVKEAAQCRDRAQRFKRR